MSYFCSSVCVLQGQEITNDLLNTSELLMDFWRKYYCRISLKQLKINPKILKTECFFRLI